MLARHHQDDINQFSSQGFQQKPSCSTITGKGDNPTLYIAALNGANVALVLQKHWQKKLDLRDPS